MIYDHYKELKSRYICLTEEGGGEGGGERKDTYSRSIFVQFQTVIKSELIGISICGKRDHCLYLSYTHKTKRFGRMQVQHRDGKNGG